MGRTISRVTPGTLEALRQYDWPGNIREFENVIQQAVILSRDGVLDLVELPRRTGSPQRGHDGE